MEAGATGLTPSGWLRDRHEPVDQATGENLGFSDALRARKKFALVLIETVLGMGVPDVRLVLALALEVDFVNRRSVELKKRVQTLAFRRDPVDVRLREPAKSSSALNSLPCVKFDLGSL